MGEGEVGARPARRMSTTLAELVEVSRTLAATPGRLDKTALLAALLGKLDPQEIEIAVAFLTGGTRQGRIGIGYATIAKAFERPDVVATPTPETQTSLEEALFPVAPETATAASRPLAIAEVDETFQSIARLSGSGSGGAKERQIRALFARASHEEREFLWRVLSGELRQGALEGVMHEAIAAASGIDVAAVRRAVMFGGDLGAVARAAISEGRGALERFQPQIFRPIAPMLAQTAESVAEALERLGEAALEYKLDGARVQVHKQGSEVHVYSRLLNEVTAAVPEVVAVASGLGARDCIIDGEAIVLDAEGRPQPFQITMRRFGRKQDVEALAAELKVSAVWFDLLSLDGRSRVDAPQHERFAALVALDAAHVVPHALTGDLATAEAFYDRALEAGHEGIMAKASDAPYVAGGRGAAWLKIKPAHTLDLVVLAAEWGHGRRRGWLSNLHLGARDPSTGEFVMLGKTFKGMTDEMLEWQTKKLQEIEVSREGIEVRVRPELVVEVAFNDVQESPIYPGGMALRFARVKRYREDKRAEDADTVETAQAILRGETRKRRSR
jgi:DNA ligase-1